MRIFWNELKKLLNWRLLLILAVFTGLFYYMFLSPDLVSGYPNGHPSAESLEVAKQMLKKYGPRIDAAEQKEFETVDYPAIKKAASRELAGIKEFRDAGITTVDAYEALDKKQKGGDEASSKKWCELFDALNDTIPFRFPPRPDAYYMYQAARDEIGVNFGKEDAETRAASVPSGAARERIGELEKQAGSEGVPVITNIMNGPLPTWDSMAQSLCVLLLFTVAILISPLLVRERRSGVRGIAYASRKGRPLFSVQLGASLAVAALAEAVQFAAFFILFCNGPHRDDLLFRNCDVSYELGTWRDMTFGQYIALDCAALFLLAFGYAMVSFAVSRFCKNYVTVIAVQVPVLFLAVKLNGRVLGVLFNVYRSRYLEPLVCVLCALVPLILCLFLLQREKRADILT